MYAVYTVALALASLAYLPAFALRMLFGEMADALLLGGQRVVPARSLEQGFYFRYPELDLAFRAVYQT